MINKLTVQSIIDKYYLGTNESVKWIIENNSLSIDFMTPTKDVIGKVTSKDFELEDSICNGDLLLELEKRNAIYTKLKISDLNFNLNYALSDPLLIGKVGEVNEAEWVVKLDLTQEDVVNIIKAKSALAQIDNMLVTTTTNLDGENVVEFVFGDESGHNNKITYQVLGDVKETDIKLPFNSDTFKTILQANKDMDGGQLLLSSMGLMRLNFDLDDISSKYFMVRKAETEF